MTTEQITPVLHSCAGCDHRLTLDQLFVLNLHQGNEELRCLGCFYRSVTKNNGGVGPSLGVFEEMIGGSV